MLRDAENLGVSSGIQVVCDVPCRVLEGNNWKLILENISGSIIFIDEENVFINTEEFAESVRGSDNYFVLITRENLSADVSNILKYEEIASKTRKINC